MRLCSVVICVFHAISFAADITTAAKSTGDEISELKIALANQQKQIEELRRALDQQQKMLDGLTGGSPRGSIVASTTPMMPSGHMPVATLAAAAPTAQGPEAQPQFPTQLHIGTATIMPVGFMDLTSVWRSTNPGSEIGSNFGGIPFLNTTTGRLSEFRLSTRNSRIGARVDANVKGAHVMGYWESDFLGNQAANVAVSSNSTVFRMRLYWVDVRKDKWEILGGQSWSMLTPGRSGISPLPGDIFYTQDTDVNYQAGLVWSRDPQLRLVYHPTNSLAMGLSLEESEQYIGGSAGGGIVTLPSALATPYASQLNNGATNYSAPNVMPDIVAKIAYDRLKKFHFEIGGVVSAFKVYNPNNLHHYYATGGGVQANVNFDLVKGLRVLTNNYWSDGGGRWIFGQAPDVIVRSDGSLGLIHAGSTVTGLEFTHKNSLLYTYYGGIYIGRNATIDPITGRPVGYGYAGSPNGQNRTIQELTFGFNQTFWKDPRYGALNLMGQYSWLSRNPWSVTPGQPGDTHTNIVFFNLRYTLPGEPPSMK